MKNKPVALGSLTTRHLQHKRVQMAAREAIANSQRLFLGGYFAAALKTSAAMIEPGPWRVAPSSDLGRMLDWLHPLYCWGNRLDCTELAAEQPRPYADLCAEFETAAQAQLDVMMMSEFV